MPTSQSFSGQGFDGCLQPHLSVPSSKELLRKIERAYVKGIAAKPGLIHSGPFLISLHPEMKLRWLNNALIEDERATISAADIQSVVEVFRTHDRMPRMELFKELWPEFIAQLEGEGFQVESEMPVMVCTEATFCPQWIPAVQVERLTPESDPIPFLKVVDTAFEHTDPITSDRIERTRASLRKGSLWAAIATIGGRPAAGASLIPSDGTAELAGVGTAEEFRRQGAASAVSTALLEEFFTHGEVAWLSAGDDTARAVYERLGFQLIGTQVNISIPGGDGV